MSRQGSIFYDAPEAINALFLNENKDDLGKLVGWKKKTIIECWSFDLE